jgi:mannose-6-phosphate isomerase-like protein (cupin superfamily)
MATIIARPEWGHDGPAWRGEVELGERGANLCIVFNRLEEPGGGPRLHSHPYSETFIIREGRALFTVGDKQLIAEAGQIVIVPAGEPHRFSNLGPGPMESIDIHDNGVFETDWLDSTSPPSAC